MSGQTFTVVAAAEACQVSHRTIRRYLDAGSFPEAWRDSGGRWLIPLADLLSSGLKVHAPSPPEMSPDPEAKAKLAAVEAEVARLSAALSAERLARGIAEAQATERAQTIDLLKSTVLPQLEAAQRASAAVIQQAQDQLASAEERLMKAQAPRWWQRSQ